MMKLKEYLVPAAAIIAGGAAAAFAAPWLANKAVNTADPKNWIAPGGAAMIGGIALMALGHQSAAALAAGTAMAGAGASFALLGYANKKMLDDQAKAQATTGPLMSAGIPGALPGYRINSGGGAGYSSTGGFKGWNAVAPYSQRYASKSGMPTRSGMMPQ